MEGALCLVLQDGPFPLAWQGCWGSQPGPLGKQRCYLSHWEEQLMGDPHGYSPSPPVASKPYRRPFLVGLLINKAPSLAEPGGPLRHRGCGVRAGRSSPTPHRPREPERAGGDAGAGRELRK